MPIAMTEEQRAAQASLREWAAKADRPVRWPDLADLGVFSITSPEVGGSLVDLAAVLEQAADSLLPGPVLPTALAAVLLGQCGSDLVPLLADGRATAAVALDGLLNAESQDDGGLMVSGDAGYVLGAGGVSHLLLSAGGTWFVVPAGDAEITGHEAVDFSRPLGRVSLDGVRVPPDQVLHGLSDPTDLAVTLFAAEASGVAGWCLRTAVEHARQREQFGRPIGSFQAVKHLCVEMLCRVEQASAVAWDAARAVDEVPEEHALAAAVAGAVALDAAVDNAKDCIQVLGGIGFTWEHDAHRYLRRALALRQLAGGSAKWRRRAADLALAGERRSLRVEVDLDGAERAAVRRFAQDIAALSQAEQRIRLADSGYLVPHWPPPHGLGASAEHQLVIDEEFDRAGVSRPDLVIGGWAAPTILRHGSAEQRDRFVRPTLRGEIGWCQLFSEPEAGSDLASLRTRARRAAGGWLLTGQKVWTSLAREADWAICLARTDPEAPKHRGITYFLVDMHGAGIDIRPLREITGEERFNEVFLDDVFVPDDCVVGEVHGGWRLARTTLANERVAMGGGSSLGEWSERVLDQPAAHGPDVRERVGALVSEGLAVSLLDLRAGLRQLGGQDPGPESSVRKLVGVRHRQSAAEFAVELLGPAGMAEQGPQVNEFLLGRCLSIAGGTTQILLNLAGERILGLPREP